MKHKITLISILLIIISLNANAQLIQHNPEIEDIIHAPKIKFLPQKPLTNDTSFDVNFYHLDLEISIDSAYVQGNVSYLFTSKANGLNSIVLDLDSAFIIDSVSSAASSYNFVNGELRINFATIFNQGDLFSFAVYYHGIPPLAGGYKGLRYETHDGNEPVIASLSTPYLAHTWWPCKDGVHDKADSTFIDITIKDTVISNLPMIVVSNGLLDTVETIGAKKTFKWKHFYPIVPYYVMVAISNYVHFQQTFNGSGYSFPIDYYVFTSHLTDAQNGVAQLPNVMNFFTNTFGDYPFRNEKYGMLQLGYYGGIENQTMSIVNNMSIGWFGVSVHELSHQWFADMITCKTWNHGWLNEGFASYAEALYYENTSGFTVYQNYMKGFEYFDGGSVYMNDVSNPFTLFQNIIYNKGAYVLHMLRGIMGDTMFFDAIKTYAADTNFRYKHATTEEFQAVCENVSGQNLNYFFLQWIYDERYPKYKYNYSYDQNSSQLDILIQQTQSNYGWRNVFTMPIEIKVNFTDLTDTIIKVFNNSQFQTFSFTVHKAVSNIELDPNKWILKKAIFDASLDIINSEITEESFVIFPNPASNNIHIESEFSEGEISISIYDINGKILHSEKHQSSEMVYNIDIESLATGIYIIEIATRKGRYVQKLSVINQQ